MQSSYDEASRAFDDGDIVRVRDILQQLIASGDLQAHVQLGTLLTLAGDATNFDEGIAILHELADSGSGHAAHNLGVALRVGAPGRASDPDAGAKFLQQAVESGFEATVASDVSWWKRPIPSRSN